MGTSRNFVFEPPSDEEIEHEAETGSEEEVEDPHPDPDSEIEEEKQVAKDKKSQSPWDFSLYSESVADEHLRRSTTSIDYKISKALKQHSIPTAADDDSDENSNPEPHRQEDYRPDDDDEVETLSRNDVKSFFAPIEGVSFHSNSFLELHLSRPLLRACEALGYSKPTPIQAACIPLALTGG